jgi:hypothetical protein
MKLIYGMKITYITFLSCGQGKYSQISNPAQLGTGISLRTRKESNSNSVMNLIAKFFIREETKENLSHRNVC